MSRRMPKGSSYFDGLDGGCLSGTRRFVRGLLDGYPPERRGELQKDIETGDEKLSHGAFFELYIFRLLDGLGYSVEIDPKVGKKTPDFRAVDGDGRVVYVEATTRRMEALGRRCPRRMRRRVEATTRRPEDLGGGFACEVESILSNGLRIKAEKYKSAESAFVIAVNYVDWHDHSEIYGALHKSGGIFCGGRNSGVSAIVACAGLRPWSIHAREPGLSKRPCLHLNPAARFPLEGPLCEIDRAYPPRPGSDHPNIVAGKDPEDLLGTPDPLSDCRQNG